MRYVRSVVVQLFVETTVYRYEMPSEKFTPRLDDSGHYVCRETVRPLRVEPMRDLFGAIVAEGVEIRVVHRLGPIWRRVHRESTLHFSGTRLRNAVGYPSGFGVEGSLQEGVDAG